jgi:hypothetical protein
MDTVRVSVSSYRVTNELLGTVEPSGKCQQASVDVGVVVMMLLYMIGRRANVGVQIEELGKHRIAVTHEHGLTHMMPGFPEPDGDWSHEYSWLYVIESDPTQDVNALHPITDMLRAMCNTYRDICSPAMLVEVMRLVGDNSWEIANLRAALEYYGARHAWRESTLVSDYAEEIMRNNPSQIASDALQNRRVDTLPEAVQKTINRRGAAAPEFIVGRLSRM